MRIICQSVPRILWGIHCISIGVRYLGCVCFPMSFLILVIVHLCVINLVSSPLYVVNVRFFFFLLLVDGGDVYVVAAADSGFVVVLAVLTR